MTRKQLPRDPKHSEKRKRQKEAGYKKAAGKGTPKYRQLNKRKKLADDL